MKTIKKSKWPEWIKAQLGDGKNKEVKLSNGNLYLYEYKNTYNKKLKRSEKTTRYLGVLKQISRGKIYEHGQVAFLLHLISKHRLLEKIKKHFPDQWKEILAFSLNRVISSAPLKRIGSWVEKTTLTHYLKTNNLSGKWLSDALGEVGINVKGQSAFMHELIKDKELLLYDGSVIYSNAQYNKLLEIGYDKNKLFLPKANITLLFSKDRNVPVHFRLFFGSVHEIRTMKTIIDEISNKNIIFVADKGYYKNKLYDELNALHINFVMPLPRDDNRIDYNKKCSKIFDYNKRIIKYTSYKVGKYYLYHYEDQYLKYEETTTYYKLKLAKKKVKLNQKLAGKIAILSNIKLSPKKIYLIWKSRDRIEKAFNILQNYLETDNPYISREETFRGYLFASFISLILYYLILNVLQKYKINDKVSVDDILFEFSKIMVEDRKYLCFTEIPLKVEELAKKIKVYDIITKIGES